MNGKKKKKKVWLIVLLVLVALVILIGAAAYGILKYYHSLLDYRPEGVEETMGTVGDETDEETLAAPASDDEVAKLEEEMQNHVEENAGTDATESVYNLLLVGVDSRGSDFSGRSDSMILIAINQESQKLVATSLLRDIFVTIPGYGTNRLNAAYAYGGMSLLKDTIQANFGIRVDRCVVTNFDLVRGFVDAVGGVEIQVDNEEIPYMNGNIGYQNSLQGLPADTDKIPEGSGGLLHLNGQQALGFARIRYLGTDFGRTERQREILAQCFQKVRGMGLGELNDLAHSFLPRLRTDLSETDCAYLLTLLLQVKDYNLETLSLPVSGSWSNMTIRGMAVLSVDFAQNTQAWLDAVTGR